MSPADTSSVFTLVACTAVVAGLGEKDLLCLVRDCKVGSV